MKRYKFFCLAFVFSLLISGCSETGSHPSFKTLYIDYLAQLDIKREKFEDALARYYSLLEEDGNRPGIHSNIGVILSGIQRPEDALKSLQHALKLAEAARDPEMVFKLRYNLGVYFGAQKKIPEALENYQAALDLLPTSNEIKTNIELLMQQQQNEQKKNGQGEKNKEDQDKGGQGEKDKEKKPGEDQEDPKDDSSDSKENQEKDNGQKRENSPKYQPRPFNGDQLSEADVKKILGELRNQEQKIRANFDRKEKGKVKNNEKNW